MRLKKEGKLTDKFNKEQRTMRLMKKIIMRRFFITRLK